MSGCNKKSSERTGFSPCGTRRAKARRLRSPLVALTLVVLVSTALHAQAPVGQTSLSGRVVADATDEPVRRANVIAFGTTTRTMSITSTDADGQFQFPALPEDRYRIGVSRSPYVSAIADASVSPAVFRLARGAVVSGHVVNALGRPQRSVPIVVRTAAGVEAGRTTTDARGLYRVYGLTAGDYLVAADGVPLAAPITLATGEERSQVHFTLPPSKEDPVSGVVVRGLGLSSIAGVVRDDRGDPMAGLPVTAYLRSQLTEVPFLLPGPSADTDEHGRYAIGELLPGDYLVCVCGGRLPRLDPPMLRQLIRQSPQPAQLLPFMAASAAFTPATFYPGRARATDAMIVSLTEADHRLGIDITVPIRATHTVFGHLVAQGQAGVEGTTVRLVLAGDLPEAIAFTEMVPRRIAADGRFSIPGVPPGDYAIIAYPPKRLGPTGMTLVTVEDRDVTGVTVPLAPGGTIRGRVAFAPGATPPSERQLQEGQIYLHSIEANPILTRMADPSGRLDLQTSVRTDGTFELSGVPPGRYRLSIGGFALPWYSIESLATSQGVARDHVFTSESGVQTDVVLTMSAVPPATLEGAVQLDKDEEPRSLNIVLVASDWRTRRSFFRTGAGVYAQYASADGTFRFPTVPAGDYFVVAVTYSDFQLTEARLTQWERVATRITLRPGETTTIALKR